jgi:hypothetical protein
MTKIRKNIVHEHEYDYVFCFFIIFFAVCFAKCLLSEGNMPRSHFVCGAWKIKNDHPKMSESYMDFVLLRLKFLKQE